MGQESVDTQVSIRDLQRNATAVLRLVEHGQTVTITRHGRTVARIMPPDPAEVALAHAAEAGVLDLDALASAPTAAALARHRPSPYQDGEESVSAALAALRDADGER